MKVRVLLVALCFALGCGFAVPTSVAEPCNGFECNTDKSGVALIGQTTLRQWGTEWAKQRQGAGPRYEYKTVDSCGPGGSKAGQEDCITNRILLMCPGADGPMVDILRRQVSATGNVLKPWARIGLTCLPNEVPGAAKRPTMAMIRDAMHHTPWAKATIGFQPKGYKTLVNLPNFYAANWSAAGFGPGEVDTVDPATMFGHQVRIRPKLVSFTYHFGDEESVGPTTSQGGVYPNGDVRHTYRKAGTYFSNVTVVWGADFSVDGSPWLEIPDTVSVDEPAQPIAVYTATNRLVQ